MFTICKFVFLLAAPFAWSLVQHENGRPRITFASLFLRPSPPSLPPFFSPSASISASLPPSDVFPRSLSARPSVLLSALPRFVRIYLTDIFHGWLATTNPRGSEAHNVSRIHVDRRPTHPSLVRPSVRPSVRWLPRSLSRSLAPFPFPSLGRGTNGEENIPSGGRAENETGVKWKGLSGVTYPCFRSLIRYFKVMMSSYRCSLHSPRKIEIVRARVRVPQTCLGFSEVRRLRHWTHRIVGCVEHQLRIFSLNNYNFLKSNNP